MTKPIHIVPVGGLARRLAGYPAALRATPDAAALLMLQERLYCPDDIALGIDAALALVDAGIEAAASDRPLARVVARAGDALAVVAILVGGMQLWAWLS